MNFSAFFVMNMSASDRMYIREQAESFFSISCSCSANIVLFGDGRAASFSY